MNNHTHNQSPKNTFGQNRFQAEHTPPQPNWLVSYADMVTILLTFMILLLSMSTISQNRYDQFVTAMTGRKTGNLAEVQEKIQRVIEVQNLGGEVRTNLDEDGLTIEFSNALLFESGTAELRENAHEVFSPIESHLVQDLEPRYGLVIEGYTDDVPITSRRHRSNWELSTSRAIHVMERLQSAGLDRRRISVQGFADTRAATDIDLSNQAQTQNLSPTQLETERAANRRVIIRIDALNPAILDRIQPNPAQPTPEPAEIKP